MNWLVLSSLALIVGALVLALIAAGPALWKGFRLRKEKGEGRHHE